MKKKLVKPGLMFLPPGGQWIEIPGCCNYVILNTGDILLKDYNNGTTLAIAPKGSAVVTNWKNI